MTRVKKHIIILTSLITVSFCLLLFVLFILLPIYFSNYRSNQLESRYKVIIDRLNHQPIDKILESVKKYDLENEDFFLDLVNENGDTIYPTYSEQDFKKSTQYFTDSGRKEFSIWTQPIENSEGRQLLVIGEFPFTTMSDSKEVLLTLCPIIFLIVLLFASVNAYLFSIASNKRIKQISQASQLMRSRDPSLRCEIDGNDDLSELAEDINHLYCDLIKTINDLETSNALIKGREKEKTEFLRMTAHELKTPITSVLGLVDGMLFKVGAFKDRDHYLKVCRSILNEHAKLINTLLETTRYDQSQKLQRETVDLEYLLKSVLIPYQTLATINNIEFKVNLSSKTVQINQLFFSKAIKNVLDNAFNYVSEKGVIHLELTEECLRITNDCEMVLSEKQLEQVFKAFYRLENHKNNVTGGHGLGLYIVDQILKRHQLNYRFFALSANKMRFEVDLNSFK